MNKSQLTFKVNEPYKKECGNWHSEIIIEKNGRPIQVLESSCFDSREECVQAARALTFSLAEQIKEQMKKSGDEKVEIQVIKDEMAPNEMPDLSEVTVH